MFAAGPHASTSQLPRAHRSTIESKKTGLVAARKQPEPCPMSSCKTDDEAYATHATAATVASPAH
jgi:hypothetical protein